jgi:hypothetical protein
MDLTDGYNPNYYIKCYFHTKIGIKIMYKLN